MKLTEIYKLINKALRTKQVITRNRNFEALFDRNLISDSSISSKYAIVGRRFRHWMELAMLLELIKNEGSKFILSQFTEELAVIDPDLLKPLLRDKILSINTKDNTLIKRLKSSSYYKNLNFRPATAILTYLKSINRPATKFELSIFFGRPDNTKKDENAIISNAILLGRQLGESQTEQIGSFFQMKGWVDNKGDIYRYTPSQQPYFKFNAFFILMASVDLIFVSGEIVTLTPTASKLISPSNLIPIESKEIEQLYYELESSSQSQDVIELVVNNRIGAIEKILNQDSTFIQRINTRASQLSGRTRATKHQRKIRNELIKTISKIKAKFLCQSCNSPTFIDRYGKNFVVVHHIIEYNKKENGADVLENLIVLCPNCHANAHYAKSELIRNFYSKLRESDVIKLDRFRFMRLSNILDNIQISILRNRGVITEEEAIELINLNVTI